VQEPIEEEVKVLFHQPQQFISEYSSEFELIAKISPYLPMLY